MATGNTGPCVCSRVSPSHHTSRSGEHHHGAAARSGADGGGGQGDALLLDSEGAPPAGGDPEAAPPADAGAGKRRTAGVEPYTECGACLMPLGTADLPGALFAFPCCGAVVHTTCASYCLQSRYIRNNWCGRFSPGSPLRAPHAVFVFLFVCLPAARVRSLCGLAA